MINTGRIICIQVNLLYGFVITTQHNYVDLRKYVASGHVLYKNKCPRNGSGGNSFERRFLCFHKDSWISFQSDSWTLILVFQRDMDSVFRTLDILDWFSRIGSGFSDFGLFTLVFTQGSDLVFRTFGLLDWFFYWTLD
jgi:hypothetical protein